MEASIEKEVIKKYNIEDRELYNCNDEDDFEAYCDWQERKIDDWIELNKDWEELPEIDINGGKCQCCNKVAHNVAGNPVVFRDKDLLCSVCLDELSLPPDDEEEKERRDKEFDEQFDQKLLNLTQDNPVQPNQIYGIPSLAPRSNKKRGAKEFEEESLELDDQDPLASLANFIAETNSERSAQIKKKKKKN
jgi:hypothetical protein